MTRFGQYALALFTLFAFSFDVAAAQNALGRIELVEMQRGDDGAFVHFKWDKTQLTGEPPVCGGGHARLFRTSNPVMQAALASAASSGAEVFVLGSEEFCGPYPADSNGVQLIESLYVYGR